MSPLPEDAVSNPWQPAARLSLGARSPSLLCGSLHASPGAGGHRKAEMPRAAGFSGVRLQRDGLSLAGFLETVQGSGQMSPRREGTLMSPSSGRVCSRLSLCPGAESRALFRRGLIHVTGPQQTPVWSHGGASAGAGLCYRRARERVINRSER